MLYTFIVRSLKSLNSNVKPDNYPLTFPRQPFQKLSQSCKRETRRKMSKLRNRSESEHEAIQYGTSIVKTHEIYKKEPLKEQPRRPKIDTTVDRNTYSYEFTNDSIGTSLEKKLLQKHGNCQAFILKLCCFI